MIVDTHVLLWWLADDPKLGANARQLISSGDNDVLVSAISGAEIAVKSSVGKLRLPDDLVEQLQRNAFVPLPLSIRHGLAVAELPMHHRDPFDRLLIAQARCEDVAILTADRVFATYEVRVIDGLS